MGQSNSSEMGTRRGNARCIAIVGPYLCGKTTLMEAILARTGAAPRQRKTSDPGNNSDAGPEQPRANGMGVSASIAEVAYLDDTFTFIDCPGSIEFQYEAVLALTVCDAAIVVCDPDIKRLPAL